MNRLKFGARVLAATAILVVVLSTAAGLPGRALAQGPTGVDWHVNSQINDSQTDAGQTMTDRSQQQSSDGQDINDDQTHKDNQDGTSVDHEDIDYSDGKGNSDSRHRDDQTDSKGTRKRHTEETTDRNGNCVMVTTDEEFDSHGNLTKKTESPPRPCAHFKLQVSLQGSLSLAATTITWGPNIALISFEKKGSDYTGSYSGEFDAEAAGKCSGYGTYPVTFNVTAKEDEFQDLDFSVQTSMAGMVAVSCFGAGGSGSMPPVTNTRTFTLPPTDGASKVYSAPMGASGNLSLTFTLKKSGH
jgi:hypothetical protein